MTCCEIAELAQNLARATGFALFPVTAERWPLPGSNGPFDAERDPLAIAGLWERYPGPLIAVATGELSGVDVIDVNVTGDAMAWWEIARRHLVTRTYRTPSGGLHAYLRHINGITTRFHEPLAGVHVHADGGGWVVYWFAHGFDCEEHAPPAIWPGWLRASVGQ